MRVLFISRITVAHGVSGGMEASLQALAANLYERGVTIALLTTVGMRDIDSNAQFDRIWTIPCSRPGKYSLIWWLRTFRHAALASWKPDLVISISSAGSASLLGNPRIRHVAQSHGTAVAEVRSSIATPSPREYLKIPLNMSRILREIIAYRRFSEVWAVSEEVERQLSSSPYRLDLKRLVQIPNGIDFELYRFRSDDRLSIREAYGVGSEVSLAITLGRLHLQKGVDLAIRALAEDLTVSRQLIIIGDGPERPSLEALAKTLSVADRVIFTGNISKAEIPKHLSAADVLLFPTRRKEGLPLSLLEALASGLPVMTTDGCNVPSDLADLVRVCGTESGEMAAVWGDLGRDVVDRRNLIPVRYKSETMDLSYAARVAALGRSENGAS